MRRCPLRRPAPVAAACVLLASCTGPIPVEDPYAVLAQPSAGPRLHLGAMTALDAEAAGDEAYVEALSDVIWRPGYTIPTREEAFERLAALDEPRLKLTIRRHLPRLSARGWQERLCDLVAERGWVDLSPAIVSAWARPIGFVDDLDRVEYRALERLHGAGNVIDAVFVVMMEAGKPSEIGLRTRAWELLLRLGQRERLTELLALHGAGSDDAMLADLAAGAAELGVFPATREEIIWLRKLREPEQAGFYAEAVSAVAGLDAGMKGSLELRDLPILVTVARHEPALLETDVETLYRMVEDAMEGVDHHVNRDRFQGFPGSYAQMLAGHRDRLTWGDLAAMLMARRAMQVPEVAEHLFDYADRDHEDESCEYGGVIALDHLGRFEILEFPPRIRRHDNEFIASQRMLDAAYTAVFHFHNHAQRHRNGKHAGPGIGDINYADNLRANCLVFTFVNRDTLNVDFYRHGRVIVDLGEVHRPTAG